MQRWWIRLGAVTVGALLAAGSLATSIREGGTVPSAATGLAADALSSARGALEDAGGEVGPAPERLAIEPLVVPEPTTLVLVSLGLAGLTVAGRRRA